MANMDRRGEEGQIGLVALVVTLLLVGVLSAILLGTDLAGSGTGLGDSVGVGSANDIEAKTTLSDAVTAVQGAAAAGGYAVVSVATITASDPTLHFTTGATTSPFLISIATSASSSTPAAPTPGAPSPGSPITTAPSPTTLPGGVTLPGGKGIPGFASGSADAREVDDVSGGSVSMAVYAGSGTCWYAWLAPGEAWYGAETDQKSCAAPQLALPPSPGAVGPTAIGWQQNTFPVA